MLQIRVYYVLAKGGKGSKEVVDLWGLKYVAKYRRE
jgi:hypothetical protein